MEAMQTYFTQQGQMSNPGKYTALFDHLPTTIPELVKIVQNITIHVFWVEKYGVQIVQERTEELQLRTIERRLERTLLLDSRPLTDKRPIEKKLYGNCRDHSLLLVSMFRHLGIPARARCGFGTYFMPNHFEDHWVVEYWNQSQNCWVLVDAQLDELQCGVLNINFDPLDVPRDQFIVGGKAWQMCRSGDQEPNKFGIFEMNGLGFVRGNLVRDVASLIKMEMLPWDCWGIILNEQLGLAEDLKMLDEIAVLTENDVPEINKVQELYQQDIRLRLGDSCLSYVNGKMIPVNLTTL